VVSFRLTETIVSLVVDDDTYFGGLDAFPILFFLVIVAFTTQTYNRFSLSRLALAAERFSYPALLISFKFFLFPLSHS